MLLLLNVHHPVSIGVIDWINHNRPSDSKFGNCRGGLMGAPYLDHLPLEEFSLASALQDEEYQTWHVGKWHIGKETWYPENERYQYPDISKAYV